MKLRLTRNLIRVRLDHRDLGRLIEFGRVDDDVQFGPGLAFSYAVEIGSAPRERPNAFYAAGRLTIRIDREDAVEWVAGGRVGFDHEQPVDARVVRVLLEKDLACIDGPPGEEPDDAHFFHNLALADWTTWPASTSSDCSPALHPPLH